MFFRLLGFLKNKLRKPDKRPAHKGSPADPSRPKNGRLVVALIGALAMMVTLVTLNIRLIRDPSISAKILGHPASVQDPTAACFPVQGESVGADTTVCSPPPEVTFYRKLKTTEDKNSWNDVAREGADSEVGQEVSEEEPSEGPSIRGKKSELSGAAETRKSLSAVKEPSSILSLPRSDKGMRTYVVQVGAFTRPDVAQQWAAKWKSRGYHVVLKPAARPKTGVIYRLYLGNFFSEAEADELVNRLKAKEGITAFRLAVRNGN